MKISTILFFCLLMTACIQTKSFHRINGWYYVTSQTTDSLSQTPFLTVKDFDSLRLETDAFGHSVITGVFLQDKLPIWREATTKSVGKYIAFVFNDTVITAPQVNSPIESGCFQISNPHGYDLEHSHFAGVRTRIVRSTHGFHLRKLICCLLLGFTSKNYCMS